VISLKRFLYYWNGVPRATNSVAPVDFRTSFLATSVLALWNRQPLLLHSDFCILTSHFCIASV
jgi:hypothetical protein